ncbi:unnamed protein product [Timema podura]|uniref:Uncharacterized protein n=1 Tax=Timema podura TaxID=61482 RepID=A0ABN7PBV1_TIMPD|nr:unnamed protein product [Timema podura]
MLASVSDDCTIRIWGPVNKHRNQKSKSGPCSVVNTSLRQKCCASKLSLVFVVGHGGDSSSSSSSSNGSVWHDMGS